MLLMSGQAFAHDDTIPPADGLATPSPPVLPQPAEGQTLYQIDSTQSEARYGVQEVYVGGLDGKLVIGRTNAINGDILIDWQNPAQSRLGMVTVNVEQLTSDSRQRDRQIRNGYLESSLYPEATFIPEAEQSFPASIAVGKTVSFVLHGYLTVREVTTLADWNVTLTLEAERLTGQATTNILMSDFGVGPISIVGLLSTEDAMQLTLDFVATTDGISSPAVEDVVEPVQPLDVESDLTFSDVRPIIETNCVGCHVEGEIGHTIYPMETVGDVTDFAGDLALVVATGYMPPWPPSDQTPEFLHDRSLTELERAQLLAWVEAGAPSDVAADTPLVDNSPPKVEVREDIKLTMPEPYVPAGDIVDDYRCFLLDPQLAEGGYVTASEILPDEGLVAHHAFIFQVSAEARELAAEKAAEDDRLGWECFGNTELATTDVAAIADSLGAWVPGSQPMRLREGTGIFVEPGNLLVLQMHYNYAAGFLPDRSSIVLEVEPASAELAPVRGLGLNAPVGIPCPDGIDTPQCDRETALSAAGPEYVFLSHSIMTMCGQTPDDYADASAENYAGTCTSRVPVDGKIVEVGGHMHTLGKSLRLTLTRAGKESIILQDIPHWDFNWQGSYQLAEPIEVSKGDLLELTCVFDNSAETDPAKARFVIYGEGTDDEMCLNVIKIEPTPAYWGLSTNEMLFSSIITVPEWVPTPAKMGAFVLSLLPTQVYAIALLVGGGVTWFIVRRRRRRRAQTVAA